MKKLIKKIFRATGRFLWPEKKKWGSFEAKLKESSKKRLEALPPLAEWPILKRGLDETTPQCRGIIQGAFDRAYGPGVLEPVYVSRKALNKPLTPDMVPHSELPRNCPLCFGPLMLSKKDNRVCACRPCGVTYLTREANEDPNICADIVHCKAGIVLREEKLEDNEND